MATYVGTLTKSKVYLRDGIVSEWRCTLSGDTNEEVHRLAMLLHLKKAGGTRDPATDTWSYSLSPGNRERALRLGATAR